MHLMVFCDRPARLKDPLVPLISGPRVGSSPIDGTRTPRLRPESRFGRDRRALVRMVDAVAVHPDLDLLTAAFDHHAVPLA